MGWAQPSHILIIVAVALILFAGPKMPQIARNFGESMRVFRSEVRQMKDESKEDRRKDTTAGEPDPRDPEGPVSGRVIDGERK